MRTVALIGMLRNSRRRWPRPDSAKRAGSKLADAMYGFGTTYGPSFVSAVASAEFTYAPWLPNVYSSLGPNGRTVFSSYTSPRRGGRIAPRAPWPSVSSCTRHVTDGEFG